MTGRCSTSWRVISQEMPPRPTMIPARSMVTGTPPDRSRSSTSGDCASGHTRPQPRFGRARPKMRAASASRFAKSACPGSARGSGPHRSRRGRHSAIRRHERRRTVSRPHAVFLSGAASSPAPYGPPTPMRTQPPAHTRTTAPQNLHGTTLSQGHGNANRPPAH